MDWLPWAGKVDHSDSIVSKAAHSSLKTIAADLWMESVWIFDAVRNEFWPDAGYGCPPLPCSGKLKFSAVFSSGLVFSRVSVESAKLPVQLIKISACWQQPYGKIYGSPSHQTGFVVGVFDSCKIVVWQNYSVGVLCVAISVWQNRVLSSSRLLSAKAKCWDLLSQTTGKVSSLSPWLPKREWDSSADSRRLGCAVALYFGLLTISLTQYPASLDFFATPEDNKALKACRGIISMWPLFSLLLWQAGMIRETMDRNDDGISFSPHRPAQNGLWYQSAGGSCPLCSCSEGRIGVGGASLENIK